MKIKTKHLRQLHIYCSLICCTLLLVFSITGISLNHRALFEALPIQNTTHFLLKQVDERAINLLLQSEDISLTAQQIRQLMLQQELSLPSPGKRVELFIEDQKLFIEKSDFGLISQLNELHQARYTSALWKIVSDLTALVFIFIALTGVWLSLRDNKQRRNYLSFLTISLISFIVLME